MIFLHFAIRISSFFFGVLLVNPLAVVLFWIVRCTGSFRWDLSSEIVAREWDCNELESRLDFVSPIGRFLLCSLTNQSRKWLLECTVSRFLVLRELKFTRVNGYIVYWGWDCSEEESSVRRGIFGWETSESEFDRVNSEPTFPVDDDQQSKFCIRFERYIRIYIYTHTYFDVLRSFIFIFVIINSYETTYVDIESVYKGDTFFQEWYIRIVNLVENMCDAVLFFREYNVDNSSWIWNEIIRASFFAYVKNILVFVFLLLFISTVVVERVFWLSFVVKLVVKRKLDIEKYVDRR